MRSGPRRPGAGAGSRAVERGENARVRYRVVHVRWATAGSIKWLETYLKG